MLGSFFSVTWDNFENWKWLKKDKKDRILSCKHACNEPSPSVHQGSCRWLMLQPICALWNPFEQCHFVGSRIYWTSENSTFINSIKVGHPPLINPSILTEKWYDDWHGNRLPVLLSKIKGLIHQFISIYCQFTEIETLCNCLRPWLYQVLKSILRNLDSTRDKNALESISWKKNAAEDARWKH